MKSEARREQHVRRKERDQPPKAVHPRPCLERLLMMFRVRRIVLCAVVVPMSALAGQVDTTRRADSTAAGAARRLAPVIVSASREPTPEHRLGVSASILTGADLKVEPAFSATDAVSRLPGVYMDANAGPGGPTNIRLRGADESFTKVLMDGVEVNVSGGPFRFQGITSGNVDR